MIRLFVGCAPNHEDAESQAVLEYTVRKYSSEEIEILWMKHRRKGVFSGWNPTGWATPFTGFRWALPSLCNYEGRAIYCDSDFIFLHDIAELYHQPMASPVLAKGAGGRLCISLWDCARCQFMPSVEQLRASGDANVRGRAALTKFGKVTPFLGAWNTLDNEIDGKRFKTVNDPAIKAIHYTAMRHQPHLLKYAIPRLEKDGRRHWFDGVVKPHWLGELQTLFDRLLTEAADAGYTVEKYCRDPIYGDYQKRSVSGVKDFSDREKK